MEIKLSQTITGKTSLSVVEKVSYNDLNTYEDSFKELLDLGVLIANSIKDNHWKMPCKIRANIYDLFFDLEVYKEQNNALKTFILLRRKSGLSPHKCYDELLILKKVIHQTQGFKNVSKLEKYFISLSGPRSYTISMVLTNFLSFYDSNETEKLLKITENIPYAAFGNRNLPNFHDVLVFNDIINDFFHNRPVEESIKYLPILLWWLITNILPMRPNEFLLMRFDCLEYKNGGTKWICVPRIKKESDNPIPVITYQSFEIDDKVYQLINFYKIKLYELGIEKSEFLFPREFYQKFRINKKTQAFHRMTLYNFSYLLDEFYDEIVKKTYLEFSLERIKPGDTRHFAIINMFLQGFNMLSIARMAGHDQISTQENYYSHASHFSQSYVYILAQKLVEKKISDTFSEGLIGWRREAVDRGKIYTTKETANMRIVEYGYCRETDELFPNSCIEDCRLCNKYIFKPDITDYHNGIKWMEDYSSQLEQRINETLALMKDQSSSLAFAMKPSSEEILKTNSRKVVSYMDHKAIVDSRLMEENVYE